MHPFTEVRTKFKCIDSVCELVSIIQAEGKSLEEFAMIAWLIWVQRNKQRHNEPVLPSSKIAQTALSLLHEFQQGKQRNESQTWAGPVRWQPPPVGSVKANFDGVVFREE